MGLFVNIAALGTNTIIIIMAIAVSYIVFATFLSRWLTNAKRMRHVQAEVKILTKEMNELVKNKAPPAEMAAKQKQVMVLMRESMGASFKPMLVLLPLTLVLYDYGMPALLQASQRAPGQNLLFIALVIGGIVASIITYLWDKAQMKKEGAVKVVSQPVATVVGKEI